MFELKRQSQRVVDRLKIAKLPLWPLWARINYKNY